MKLRSSNNCCFGATGNRTWRPLHLHCNAAHSTTASGLTRPQNELLVQIVETIFTFPPVFDLAASSARKKILDRAKDLGVDFKESVTSHRSRDWDNLVASVTDPDVQIPDYYKAPFHAYKSGNLCLEAALEVTAAAKSVHASVMDVEGKRLSPNGDEALRSAYGECQKQLLQQMGIENPQKILDIGCATGLSSLALLKNFPGSSVVGIDLSPYFLAVGKVEQEDRMTQTGKSEDLTFLHRAAENTNLEENSFDMVSMSLVGHELPFHATKEIFVEAHRLLRPGGCLSIMEMDPSTPAFQRVLNNPIPYVVFKSTEPYLLEYVKLDMPGVLTSAGFAQIGKLSNSPRHKTVIATKK